ncbi:hypothetical protein B1H10_08665 [candidate division KSB1 bacterium 4484_188]|nr:MAG: hypothetical protein B1H10_08665 [candidate division KSB1 bacterium 4484_188]
MEFLENLVCGCEECHYNHENYCYHGTVTLDIGASCEDMETCEFLHQRKKIRQFRICLRPESVPLGRLEIFIFEGGFIIFSSNKPSSTK